MTQPAVCIAVKHRCLDHTCV